MHLQRSSAIAIALACAALGATFTAAASKAAQPPCWKQLLNDWYDGLIEHAYPVSCYRRAIAALPEDQSAVATELRGEIAEAAPSRVLPPGQRGRRGARRDPCPALDPAAPCPLGLEHYRARPALHVSGALQTNALRSNPDEFPTCAYRASTRTFLFESAAMRLRGTEVARVAFTIRTFAGAGGYSATRPRIEYGRTPVQVATARNVTTGAASDFFYATGGTVTIDYTHEIGRRGHYGFAAGTVSAKLSEPRSQKPITLTGSWTCSAEPVANGPG
jgi:hypothetical protein